MTDELDKNNAVKSDKNNNINPNTINNKTKLPEEKELKEILAIENIIEKYVLSVNKKYNSHVFPSSQLTKVVMKELGIENKNKFRIYHTKVKNILKRWELKNYCEHIDTTHYAHCKKTKMIYQFSDDTFYKFNIYKIIPIP
ncbi:MAG: hypothetical protein ACTSRP_08885 [Candidatus Helarchaeota archaeon]